MALAALVPDVTENWIVIDMAPGRLRCTLS